MVRFTGTPDELVTFIEGAQAKPLVPYEFNPVLKESWWPMPLRKTGVQVILPFRGGKKGRYITPTNPAGAGVRYEVLGIAKQKGDKLKGDNYSIILMNPGNNQIEFRGMGNSMDKFPRINQTGGRDELDYYLENPTDKFNAEFLRRSLNEGAIVRSFPSTDTRSVYGDPVIETYERKPRRHNSLSFDSAGNISKAITVKDGELSTFFDKMVVPNTATQVVPKAAK